MVGTENPSAQPVQLGRLEEELVSYIEWFLSNNVRRWRWGIILALVQRDLRSDETSLQAERAVVDTIRRLIAKHCDVYPDERTSVHYYAKLMRNLRTELSITAKPVEELARDASLPRLDCSVEAYDKFFESEPPVPEEYILDGEPHFPEDKELDHITRTIPEEKRYLRQLEVWPPPEC